MTKQVYKNICVYAPMAEKMEPVSHRKQVGTRKTHKIKGILNPKKIEVEEPIYEYIEDLEPTGEASDTDIDHDAFNTEVNAACNHLDDEGYEVISINPVSRGVHTHQYSSGSQVKGSGPSGFGYGYGYSITSAFIITGKLKNDTK